MRSFALTAAVALTATLIYFVCFESHFTKTVSATMAPGEFWRLPWRADAGRIVSGNGYGEATHDDDDHWALDFQASLGTYVMAAQEGRVTEVTFGNNCGTSYGTRVIT